jgi:hypothetical protein
MWDCEGISVLLWDGLAIVELGICLAFVWCFVALWEDTNLPLFCEAWVWALKRVFALHSKCVAVNENLLRKIGMEIKFDMAFKYPTDVLWIFPRVWKV